MAIRFRKTFKVAPGLKLNLGKKSASVRIGGKNFGHTIGTAGRTTSASIPGTGLGITTKHKKQGDAPASSAGSMLMGMLGVVLVIVLIVAFWPR